MGVAVGSRVGGTLSAMRVLWVLLSIGLIVGGSIVIPHLRRAVDRWGELEKASKPQG